MTFDPERHHRRSIRLKGHDYAQAGAYFITISTHDRACLFGQVVDDTMEMSDYGRIVEEEWLRSSEVRREILLHAGEFVVMPNHVHGIVWIVDTGRGDRPVAPTEFITQTRPGTAARANGPAPRSLGAFVAGFKAATTKRINQRRNTPGVRVWQRNYYEHVICDEASLDRIRRYIAENPMRWACDPEDPQAIETELEELWNPSCGMNHRVSVPGQAARGRSGSSIGRALRDEFQERGP
ncbi:hypothetical protein NET02_13680 [Thermomicrobiaceae bacterium CFH 74404]|uniref:Transposase IS200-like domain-containing protein n=1 Tax=Thermalbibacter longus TaxID=2951981 RepID=A0AA42BDX8_9BACT|nr:transposase [Thermalbibacter longus]MCM8750198.1 hypothetical protein [Thermalbibacter longus]